MAAVDDFAAKAAEAEAMTPPPRPTEAMVGPVKLAIRRSWPYNRRPADGDWYAALDVGPLRGVWSCHHGHAEESAAWGCAQRALQILVLQGADPNDYEWAE